MKEDIENAHCKKQKGTIFIEMYVIIYFKKLLLKVNRLNNALDLRGKRDFVFCFENLISHFEMKFDI